MNTCITQTRCVSLSPPRQNGRHFADQIFRYIFDNEKLCILLRISLKFVHTGPVANKPTLVQIMAWHLSVNKPLSEPLMAQFTDVYIYIYVCVCVMLPGWVDKHIDICIMGESMIHHDFISRGFSLAVHPIMLAIYHSCKVDLIAVFWWLYIALCNWLILQSRAMPCGIPVWLLSYI